VPEAAVQKCVSYELPEIRPGGNEHEMPYPRTEHHAADARVYMIFEEKNNDVGSY
jgi:hypothetical protein